MEGEVGYRGKCEVVLEREDWGLLWRVKGVGVRRGTECCSGL